MSWWSLAALLSIVPIVNVVGAPKERDLHVFGYSSADGTSPTLGTLAPNGGLLIGTAGEVIGSADGVFASSSGQTPNGIVFKLTPPLHGETQWSESVLHRFTGADGISPNGNLIANGRGILFGTTCVNSNFDPGTVFMLTPPKVQSGAWTHTVIHRFTGGGSPNDPGGTCPQTGVVEDSQGRLYGTTLYGGTGNGGVIWQLTPPSTATTAWTYSVIHDYDLSYANDNWLTYPLLRERFGTVELYGTTAIGGPSGAGTVYRMTSPTIAGAPWQYDILYSFTGGSDGGAPFWGLVADRKLNLYGTTDLGSGNVFRLSPPARGSTAWTETVLHAFGGGADGSRPMGVVESADGRLFGATQINGDPNCSCGTIFKVTPRDYGGQMVPWNEATLYRFTYPQPHGSSSNFPNGSLASLAFGDGQVLLFGAAIGGAFIGDFGSVYTLQP